MQLKGLLKRILPFFLTFALGLLVASFFVSVAAPNFSNFKRKKCRENYRENYQLRMENERLQQRVRDLERQAFEELKFRPHLLEPVPPPPPMPVAPRSVR